MRSFLSVVAIALFLVRTGNAAEPFDPKPVDALVKKALDAWHVPGVAVAVVRGDEVSYFCHGLREADGRDPITEHTLFPLGSCSKAFTTTAMAILVDEGKMAWDDPVRKHVPSFRLSDPLADSAVTLRDLVCHRTGLRGHELLWYRAPWSPEEAVRRAALLPLDKPFRSAFQYQSTMFTAAGLAVSSASGLPWHEFVRQRLLDPLEMKATVFTAAEAERGTDRAVGHRFNGVANVPMPTAPMDVPDAAWTVQSDAADLAKWVRFQLGDGRWAGKRLVSERNLGETHKPQMVIPLVGVERDTHPETVQMSYAMAWVVQDYHDEQLVSHAGLLDGFRVHVTLVPRRRIGIVVLANLQGTRMNLALSNTLVDHLLGLPKRDWNRLYIGLQEREAAKAVARERAWRATRVQNTKPGHDLAEYAGRYEHPAYGTIEVTVEGDGLTWRFNSFAGPLEHFHYETWVLGEPTLFRNTPVLFKPGPRGRVGSMHVRGWFDTEFQKAKPK